MDRKNNIVSGCAMERFILDLNSVGGRGVVI